MKKMFSTAAVVAAASLMLSATAFAACPIKQHSACKIGTPTGAAAPVNYSYIVSPVAQRTYLPPCNNCTQPAKKNFFQKMMTPVNNVYDAMVGPFFNLYN